MSNFNYVVTAFSVFVAGVGKAGSGEKCKLPMLALETEKFRGGGMLGEIAVPFGYKPLEMEFELNQFDPQVLSLSDFFNQTGIAFSVRGFATGDGTNGTGTAAHTIICQCAGVMESVDPGEWTAGKKASLKCKAMLTAAKLSVDAAVIYDIDLKADRYNVAGTDLYAPVRTALGL